MRDSSAITKNAVVMIKRDDVYTGVDDQAASVLGDVNGRRDGGFKRCVH